MPPMIDFPCHFPIKIIFKNEPGAQDALLAIVRHHHPDILEDAFVMHPSQNGNYISLTATVLAQNQASLDNLYRDLTQNPYTKMVL